MIPLKSTLILSLITNVSYGVSLHSDNFCPNIPLELQSDLFQQTVPLTARQNCAAQADSEHIHHQKGAK